MRSQHLLLPCKFFDAVPGNLSLSFWSVAPQADVQWQEYKRQQETPTRAAKVLAVFLLLLGISFLCTSCLHFAGHIHTKSGAVRPLEITLSSSNKCFGTGDTFQ